MFYKIIILIGFLSFSSISFSAEFLSGKIYQTEGHWSPSCRTVSLEYDDEGVTKRKSFRIKEVVGDDINAVVLAALMADKRVRIAYVPGETTGCGNEDMIKYITVYKD